MEKRQNILEYNDIRLQVEKALHGNITIDNKSNLLEMGLTSLQIMRLVNKWRKQGFNVTFSQIISSPYLKEWWEILNQNFHETLSNRKDDFKDKNTCTNNQFDLTDVQYAYWIGRRNEQILGGVGCHAYFEIDSKSIDINRLEDAWIKLQEHHTMLRAQFLSNGKQEILDKPFSKKVTVYDFQSYTGEELNFKLEELRNSLSHRCLDVEKGKVAEFGFSLLPNGNTRIHFDIDLLVADMQSLQIIFRDLVGLYAYNRKPLAPDNWSFSTYLKNETNNKKVQEQEDKKYWNEILDSLPMSPSIPLAKKPENVKLPVFKRREYFLDNNQWEMLKKQAAKKQVTPAMVLLTAYAEVIDRWSTNPRFLINVPLFDRQTEEKGIDDVIADFTNILLFPVDCSIEQTFEARLKNIHNKFYESMSHTAYSGVKLQRDMLKIHPDEKFFAPFVFSCNYGSPLINDEFNEKIGQLSYMSTQTPQVWLDFQIFEINNGLQLAWDAIDELFPRNLVDEMFNAYTNLITWLIKEENNWKDCYDIIPKLQEQRKIKNIQINNISNKDCIHTSFFKNALINGTKIAVVDSANNKNYSYSELAEYALKISAYLKINGVKEKDLVSVSIPREVDQIAAILGVLALGACYVPINIKQPFSRRENIHKKASIKYAITDSKSINNIKWPLGTKVINISNSKNVPPLKEPVKISSENSAYIIFTSGSTGEPKGVEISHAAAWNTIKDINCRYNINSNDRILAVSSFDFDLSVYDVFGMLSAGGSIVLIKENISKDATRWLELINKYKTTIWNSVPTLLNMLLIVSESNGQMIPTLRLVMLSGDWIGLDLPKRLKNIANNAQLLAMGGATEAAIWSNFYDVTLSIPSFWKSIPYGKPLTNQFYRIVDSKGRDCPDWVSGELWIGGTGVAKGYIGDKEITEKSFIKFNNTRWYKTGDMGRFWSDGNIEFLGRQDFQVKIRGHRIELSEIESIIKKYPGIDNAVVKAVGDPKGNKHLVGYIVENKNEKSDLFSKKDIDEKYLQKLWDNIIDLKQSANNNQLKKDAILEEYEILQKYTDDISVNYICCILDSLGSYCEKDDKYTISDLMNKCNILEDYRELITKWVETLISKGFIKNDSLNSCINIKPIHVKDFDFKMKSYGINKNIKRHIDNLIKFLNQFKENSIDILQGRLDPLNMFLLNEYISPDKYVNTLPGTQYKQNIVKDVLNNLIAYLGVNKPLNILEIGARNIEKTELYLSKLESKHIKYTCTDKSNYYINKAMDYLKKFSYVEYKQLDINEDPFYQGFNPYSYDVVIASNSLHRTYDIEKTINNVKKLMKPGAILIILESTNNNILQQVSTGFLEKGFINFKDNRKNTHLPLLSKEEWETCIRNNGFRNTVIFPKSNEEDIIFNQNVIISQSPYTVKQLQTKILKDFLNKNLPEYMVPATFLLLEKLPLTSNGKINRKTLPLPNIIKKEDLESTFIAPKTDIELRLLNIWRQVLKVNKISANDNYFELGGDSLLATQLNTMINKEFNIELSLQIIFEKPILHEQALSIATVLEDKELKNLSVEQLKQIEPNKDEWYLPFPLTDVQQSYWLGRKGGFSLGDVSTHCYFEMDCKNLDVNRVILIWQQLIKRHGMMRAVFSKDGEHQRILEKVNDYEIKVYDLYKKQDNDVQIELKKIREEMSHQTFDTDKWPLFDVRISLFEKNNLRLHISFDNIIFDGWSMFYILREWKQLYENSNNVSELNVSFRDYVMAYEEIKKTDKFQKDMDYWKTRLPNIAPAPDLPLLKDPKGLSKQRFTRLEYKLCYEKWENLKKKSAQNGLTPSALLLAAYAEILANWSKSPKFTINLTRFNRLPLHPQIMEVIGDFTSLTLLSVDNSMGKTFIKRCQELQKQLLEDLAHPYVSGVDIERELSKTYGKHQEAIMPIVFTSGLGIKQQNNKNEEQEYLGKITYGLSQTPQVWIDHQVTEQDKELILTWDVIKEIFPEGLIDDMFKAYCNLLNLLSTNNEVWEKNSESLVITPRMDKRIEANNTEKPISSETLVSLFEKQLLKNEKNMAIISPKRNLTYLEVSCYANGIGNLLIKNGAKPNKLVAIVMDKGWEQICSVVGILKSGSAYLPIDSQNPNERINLLLKDANINIVLTQSWISKKINWPNNIKYINVDELDVGTMDNSKIEIKPSPEDLAYVIYTSGSTGKPKGVMIDNKGAVNTILDINKRFMVNSKDRIIGISNLNFDLSVYDVFGTLSTGAAIVLPDSNKLKEPTHWIELIKKQNITIWNTVPAFMQMLMDYISDREEVNLSSLRLVMMSGDWIPLDLPDRIKKYCNNIKVVSLGGATEASIWSNLYPIEKVNKNWSSIPYGKPMTNQKFYILNELMSDCPVWVPGRLFIGGVGLAKGYLNDEIKTKEKFIVHPRTGERLYYTGDLGCYWPDGNIEFLGREDTQVKIRGHRIELGEIETVLITNPIVKNSIVMVEDNNLSLSASIILKQDTCIDKNDAIKKLHEFLIRKLPDYLIPGKLVILDKFPLNHNGKVDRKAIGDVLKQYKKLANNEFEAPYSGLERQIANVWENVLEVTNLSRHDDFFLQGGDSLKAVRIIAQLKSKKISPEGLTLQDIFSLSTVALLANKIKNLSELNSNFKDEDFEEGTL